MAKDHVDPEQDYFHKQDAERLRQIKEAQEAEQAEQAAEELKKLHWHRCGKCGCAMETQVFKGIEVEICTGCGSVLLDPGELEALAGKDESGWLVALAEFFRFAKRK